MEQKMNLDPDVYRRFRTSAEWFGEDENAVIERFMTSYTNSFVDSFMSLSDANAGEKTAASKVCSYAEHGQNKTKEKAEVKAAKQAKETNADGFRSWLGNQKTKKGQLYSKRTIAAYAQALANSLRRESFPNLRITNLFEISDFSEFEVLEAEIKSSTKFATLSHSIRDLLGPAMSKYAEFLCWKERN